MVILAVIVVLLAGRTAHAQQRFGYVNSQSILENLPEAQEAQKKLNVMIQSSQDSIQKMSADLQAKAELYQKQSGMMTEANKTSEQQKLMDQDQAIKQFQQTKFGQGGEIAVQREKIFAPIREKIMKIIQVVAKEEKMNFVLDKGSEVSAVLYADAQYDITFKVLDRLKRGK
jgi:outer membrane protein